MWMWRRLCNGNGRWVVVSTQSPVASGREGVSQSSSQSPARSLVSQSVGHSVSQSFIQSAIRAGPWLTRCRCDVNAMPERVPGEDLLARNANAVASGPSYGMF